jgi:predicted RNA binding protein YcfA (HicA-like mRNA interferase family)
MHVGSVAGLLIMGAWSPVSKFPAMSGRELLAALCRKPLGYVVVRQEGSHRTLRADGRPDLLFAFHDRSSIAPGLVRKILMSDIGLSDAEAWKVLRG